MTPHRIRHYRIFLQAGMMASVMLMGAGCVSTDTHQKALEELEKAKQLSASQSAELDALRKKSKADSDQMQQQLTGLQQNLDQETSQRKSAEQQAASLEKEREALSARSAELQSRLDGLEREKGQLGSELSDVRGRARKKLPPWKTTSNSLPAERPRLKARSSSFNSGPRNWRPSRPG